MPSGSVRALHAEDSPSDRRRRALNLSTAEDIASGPRVGSGDGVLSARSSRYSYSCGTFSVIRSGVTCQGSSRRDERPPR